MKTCYRATIFGLLLFVLGGCATLAPRVTPPAFGVPLQSVCERHNVTWQFDGVTQVVMLEHKGAKAKALVGSPVVLLGKEKITLSSPLRRQQSTIYVPEDFETKVIAPFGVDPSQKGIPRADISAAQVRTIVLDPGHGGKDPGAIGNGGVREKDVVLDISRRLKVLLEQAGFKVIMTRTNDHFISLPERTVIATKSDADLFVSIHANSNPVKKTKGLEAYYVKTFDKKDLEEEQRQANEKAFAKRLNMDYSPVLTNIVADMMYSHKICESQKLALCLAESVSRYVDTPNRGARLCRFFVVRNTVIPAILLETGFLSNRQEEHKLGSGGYRQRLAEGIARGIIDYATSP